MTFSYSRSLTGSNDVTRTTTTLTCGTCGAAVTVDQDHEPSYVQGLSAALQGLAAMLAQSKVGASCSHPLGTLSVHVVVDQ